MPEVIQEAEDKSLVGRGQGRTIMGSADMTMIIMGIRTVSPDAESNRCNEPGISTRQPGHENRG